MSRKPRIDWNKGGKEELRKAVRNFNAKIDRLTKKDPKNAAALPEKVKLSDFVGTKNKPGLIQTRQDLNREIKSLQRFSRKGAEELIELPNNDYGTKYTKWQKKEIAIRMGVANRRRKARKEMLESIELRHDGKPLGYTLGDIGMGKQDINQVKPYNQFSRAAGNRDVKARWRSLRRETQSTYYDDKDEWMKGNFIKGIQMNYNTEDVQDVIDAIEKMPIKEFMKRFREYGNTFEEVSPPFNSQNLLHYKEQYEGYVEKLKSDWLDDNEDDKPTNKTKSKGSKTRKINKFSKKKG